MSFKIGFTAENENNENHTLDKDHEEMIQNTLEKVRNIKKSVVDVFFSDRHLTCSYYNDMYDLKRGDIVYVDGKLE